MVAGDSCAEFTFAFAFHGKALSASVRLVRPGFKAYPMEPIWTQDAYPPSLPGPSSNTYL
ncbi:hypothetical protein MY11210_006168 [Beauveria gryllotalpidicola]